MSDAMLHKVILLGDPAVGKTAVFCRIAEDIFNPNHVATVVSQHHVVPVPLRNETVPLQLWDTAGQEVYRSLVSFYARDAQGAVIVCDVTDPKAFEGLDAWIAFLRENAPGAKAVIFGNKSDLVEKRQIAEAALVEYAGRRNIPYFDGSALTNENVRFAFEEVAGLVASEQARKRTLELRARRKRKWKC
jgi:small GTP-binding protein